jgi:hypothetical protein
LRLVRAPPPKYPLDTSAVGADGVYGDVCSALGGASSIKTVHQDSRFEKEKEVDDKVDSLDKNEFSERKILIVGTNEREVRGFLERKRREDGVTEPVRTRKTLRYLYKLKR